MTSNKKLTFAVFYKHLYHTNSIFYLKSKKERLLSNFMSLHKRTNKLVMIFISMFNLADENSTRNFSNSSI